MSRNRALLAAIIAMTLTAASASAATCGAASGARRVALLELYTSEGCDSCPPADRWVSALRERGLSSDRVVTLGFHVDYWNYLGWNDPFAKPLYSARQRAANQRNGSRTIYTPQMLLNGKDYRRAAVVDDFARRLDALAREATRSRISLRLRTGPLDMLSAEGTAEVADAASRSDARAYLALYENDLSTQVTAGENRGKRLRHDYVVRELVGPYPFDAHGSAALAHRFSIGRGWNTAELHVAAFVQNERDGDTLQALALAYCR